MNTELGRKITSLTIMTIMVAGGLSFAVPGAMPSAYASSNANLFVSAENPLFGNSAYGPMVLEVVVSDSNIASLDDAHGEPDVTINGKKLRMMQASDGNWYGYFAEKTFAQEADQLMGTTLQGYSTMKQYGLGMDFGLFCAAHATTPLGFSTTESDGIAIPVNSSGGGLVNDITQFDGTTVTYALSIDGSTWTNGTQGTSSFYNCEQGNPANYSDQDDGMGVIRENKTLNRGLTSGVQVGNGEGIHHSDYWPFIQLYTFADGGSVDVQYNKGGDPQSVSLNWTSDYDGYTGLELDRTSYPKGAEVHLTLTDIVLNIDPTDEDVWTFGARSANSSTFYGLFDENGSTTNATGNVLTDVQGVNIQGDVGTIGAGTAVFVLNNDTQSTGTYVMELKDNDFTVLVQDPNHTLDTGLRTNSIAHEDLPVTFTETGANTGVFTNYDDADNANLKISSSALRGTTATVDYDATPQSVLVTDHWGELTLDASGVGDVWNSGEALSVTLVDSDMNLNSRADEDLSVSNADHIIPTVKIGSPITLNDLSSTNPITILTGTDGSPGVAKVKLGSNSCNGYAVESFSERLNLGFKSSGVNGCSSGIDIEDGGALMFQFSKTVSDVQDFMKGGTASYNGTKNAIRTFINYDMRSLESNSTTGNSKVLSGANINITFGSSGSDSSLSWAGEGDNKASGASNTNGGFAYRASTNNQTSCLSTTSFAGVCNISNLDWDSLSSTGTNELTIAFNFTGQTDESIAAGNYTVVADIFRFGTSGDGVSAGDRYNDAIYRAELEETGDNTGIFEGSMEYIMLNQLNHNKTGTYDSVDAQDDNIVMIAGEDLTDEDAIRISYLDVGADGVATQIGAQEEAPTHSGTVEFDSNTYKVADTVVVTLTDMDLNTEDELLEIYTVVGMGSGSGTLCTNCGNDPAYDTVGEPGFGKNSASEAFGRMLDITFDDERWAYSSQNLDGSVTCGTVVDSSIDDGLGETGFTLVETGLATGVFTGDFQVPSKYCKRSGFTTTSGEATTTTGKDMEVNYVDFRDASGEIIEVGDGAGIRANTGSVSLDRTVYPVPFGAISDHSVESSKSTPNSRSVFPVHGTGLTSYLDADAETLGNGDLTIHIRIDDPDYDISAVGEDKIAENVSGQKYGPLHIYVTRGSDIVSLATAGSDVSQVGVITSGKSTVTNSGTAGGSGTGNRVGTQELGPIYETAPDSGVFELDFGIRYTDGPASSKCPSNSLFWNVTSGDSAGQARATQTNRIAASATGASGTYNCILQGDVLTAEYTDPTDASGNAAVVYDSATFDLRNGVLQADKSVYIIGSDMILTLIEPDLDLDNDGAETWDLDLIEWDSDASTLTMGNLGSSASSFDPEPSDFRETGDSTGIFQIVIEIPEELGGSKLDRGELIDLEYTDWGPSGAEYVGDEDQDINLSVYTSNFGATIELDQKVYTWTDKVYVTIVAPDHNFDSDLVDEVGDTSSDPIIIQTRSQKLTPYKLAETGTDTGIFTGEVILKGFSHDADGNPDSGTAGYDVTGVSSASGSGPTDGSIKAEDDDGLTISYEYNEDETVVGSALIRWNIGEIQWLESSYPATGTGVIRVVDPDMNWDPENVDNFDVDIWSDSDAGGIDLTVTETNEATGIFEGTIQFTVDDESSGHRLRVSEGDTITAEYEDNTLPDPYTRADDLDVTSTAIIGTIVPPLERAPAANARVVDAFGNSLSSVSVDQQVQIEADLVNGQDKDQPFAYIVQVQDGNGVTVSLAWITGSLAAGQSFSPALSWIPGDSGSYTATVFVWESVDNPTALSDTVEASINVN